MFVASKSECLVTLPATAKEAMPAVAMVRWVGDHGLAKVSILCVPSADGAQMVGNRGRAISTLSLMSFQQMVKIELYRQAFN